MSKPYAFMTPAVNGKPGEVREIQVECFDAVQYLEPVSYAVNDAEINRLRKAFASATTALAHAIGRHAQAPEITRLEQALASAKKELDAAEAPHRKQRARETGTGRDDNPITNQSLTELVKKAGASVMALMKKYPVACNASPRCTPGAGHNKCSRCRANGA